MADKRKSAAIINSGSDSDSDVSDSEFQVMHVNQIPMMQRITFQYFQHLAKKQKNAPSKSPSQSPASPRRCLCIEDGHHHHITAILIICVDLLILLNLPGPDHHLPTVAQALALVMNGTGMRNPTTRRRSWSRKRMRRERKPHRGRRKGR